MTARVYEAILQDSQGYLWEGRVVTYLLLADWCEMHHYQVQESSGMRPALPSERTVLQPLQRKRSGIQDVRAIIGKLLLTKRKPS
jgi:hypothetical protein